MGVPVELRWFYAGVRTFTVPLLRLANVAILLGTACVPYVIPSGLNAVLRCSALFSMRASVFACARGRLVCRKADLVAIPCVLHIMRSRGDSMQNSCTNCVDSEMAPNLVVIPFS